METTHLRLNPETGAVHLICPGEPEDIYLGQLEDDSDCPAEYLLEWAWLREEMEDRYRFGAACRAEQLILDFAPGGWQ